MNAMRLAALLGCAALAAFLLSLFMGVDGFTVGGSAEARRVILLDVRRPRALLGFMVGGTLGLAGAVLQGYLRNPLAEPGILGISGGAALGAVIAIHSGLAQVVALALPLAGLT
ncbi:MAG: iron chelate uptake ABC transporter family permease subunit, partial [Hyphomicrobium sp.]